ncbi:hypothetical protein BaRGS_00029678 [Batillaria attramentaria]|uniref:Uncharacterized protein n=1 Tax=Batillaria attramentaria TaxID=370345 RepID=A0ABD0JWK7_9CAEN
MPAFHSLFPLLITAALLPAPITPQARCPPPPNCLQCPIAPSGNVEKAVCKTCPHTLPTTVIDATILGGGCQLITVRGLIPQFFMRQTSLRSLTLSSCGITKFTGAVFEKNVELR